MKINVSYSPTACPIESLAAFWELLGLAGLRAQSQAGKTKQSIPFKKPKHLRCCYHNTKAMIKLKQLVVRQKFHNDLDHRFIISQRKLANIVRFQSHKCEDLLLVCILC